MSTSPLSQAKKAVASMPIPADVPLPEPSWSVDLRKQITSAGQVDCIIPPGDWTLEHGFGIMPDGDCLSWPRLVKIRAAPGAKITLISRPDDPSSWELFRVFPHGGAPIDWLEISGLDVIHDLRFLPLGNQKCRAICVRANNATGIVAGGSIGRISIEVRCPGQIAGSPKYYAIDVGAEFPFDGSSRRVQNVSIFACTIRGHIGKAIQLGLSEHCRVSCCSVIGRHGADNIALRAISGRNFSFVGNLVFGGAAGTTGPVIGTGGVQEAECSDGEFLFNDIDDPFPFPGLIQCGGLTKRIRFDGNRLLQKNGIGLAITDRGEAAQPPGAPISGVPVSDISVDASNFFSRPTVTMSNPSVVTGVNFAPTHG